MVRPKNVGTHVVESICVIAATMAKQTPIPAMGM